MASFCSLVTFSQSSTRIDLSESGMKSRTAGLRTKSSSCSTCSVSESCTCAIFARARVLREEEGGTSIFGFLDGGPRNVWDGLLVLDMTLATVRNRKEVRNSGKSTCNHKPSAKPTSHLQVANKVNQANHSNSTHLINPLDLPTSLRASRRLRYS